MVESRPPGWPPVRYKYCSNKEREIVAGLKECRHERCREEEKPEMRKGMSRDELETLTSLYGLSDRPTSYGRCPLGCCISSLKATDRVL